MVLVTNVSDRVLFRRHPRGLRLAFDAGETKNVTSKRLLEKLKQQPNAFRIENSHLIPPKTGGRRDRKERIPSKHSDNADDTPARKGRCGTGREAFKSFGKPEQDPKPKSKGLRLPKEYYKLGLKKGWRKFKEDRAKGTD